MPFSQAALVDTLASLNSGYPPGFIAGTGANGLAFLRALGRRGVPVVGLDFWTDPGMASRYAISAVVPEAEEDPEGLLDALVDMGTACPVRGALIPTTDAFILFISEHSHELSRHFHFCLSDYETIQTIANKRLQYKYAQRIGVEIPFTLDPEEDDIEDIAQEMRYPCVIKPHYSHLWWHHQTAAERKRWGKVGEARSAPELIAMYNEMSRGGLEFVIQEKIRGEDDRLFSVTTYLDRSSTPLAVFTGRKERQYPYQYGVCAMMISVEEPEVVELGLRLLKGLRFRGLASVEFKRDPEDGALKLMEINGRSILSIYHAVASGIDLPSIAYQDAVGEPVEEPQTFREGVKWIDLHGELKRYWAQRRSGGPGLGQLLRSWRGDRCFAFYARDDPLPAILDIWEYALNALRERSIPT